MLEQGPSSLLAEADAQRYSQPTGPETVAVSPSSLLPESERSRAATSAGPEVVAVSPSALLPPSPPPQRFATKRRVATVIAAGLLGVVVIGMLLRAGSERMVDPVVLLAQGQELQRKGELPGAIIVFQNLVRQQPDDAQARYLLGTAQHANGEFAEAERELRRALDLGFDSEKGLVALARSLLLQGMAQKVLDEIPAARDNDNSAYAVEINSIRGLAYLAIGNTDVAEILFKRALEVDPKAVNALLGKARIAAIDNRAAEAESLIDEALGYDARSLDALLMKAELQWALGRAEGARAAFRRVLDVYPANPQAHVSLAWMALRAGQLPAAEHHIRIALKAAPNSSQANYVHGLMEFRRKNLAAAKIAVDKVLRFNPGDVPGLLLAGAIAYAEENYPEAQQWLLRGLQRNPAHLGGRKLYAATVLKMGQISSALDVLIPTLRIAAADRELFTLIGQAYLHAGDHAEAAKYLEQASRLQPNDVKTKFVLGLSQMAAGQLTRAMSAVESGLRPDADKSELDALLVAVHVRRGDVLQAEQAWAVLHRKQPDAAVTWQLKAAILTIKKDLPGARKALEQALMLEPTFVAAAIGLAKLDLDERDPLNARQRLEKILRFDARNVEAMLTLAEIGPAIGASPDEIQGWLTDARKIKPDSVRASVLLARLHLKSHDTNGALRIAQEALKRHPEQASVLDVLGAAQMTAGDANGAIATFSRLALLMPRSADVLYRLARAQTQTGNDAAAAVTLRKLLQLQSEHPDGLALLADIHVRSGRYDEAVTLARKLQGLDGGVATGHLLEGDAAAASGDLQHARQYYEKALRLAPTGPALVRMHTVLTRLGNTQEADQLIRRGIKERPGDWHTRLYWADTLLARNNYQEAQSHYLAAIEHLPDNASVLNNLALTMIQTRDTRARLFAERALVLRPGDPALLDTLGWILTLEGETQRGIELLERAVASAPSQLEPRMHLAQAWVRAGYPMKARDAVEQALKNDPPAERVAELRSLLQSIPY